MSISLEKGQSRFIDDTNIANNKYCRGNDAIFKKIYFYLPPNATHCFIINIIFYIYCRKKIKFNLKSQLGTNLMLFGKT